MKLDDLIVKITADTTSHPLYGRSKDDTDPMQLTARNKAVVAVALSVAEWLHRDLDYTPPEQCGHVPGNRSRVGPTGRKSFMILVDECLKCKNLIPVHPLTPEERNWLWRYNQRVTAVRMPGPKPSMGVWMR